MIETKNQRNEMKKIKKIFSLFSFIPSFSLVVTGMFCLVLASCSTYSSKFNCADGRGLPCEMLRSVDGKIDSGEIDKVYKAECKGRNCKKAQRLDEVVIPNTGPIKAKANIPEITKDVVIIEESGIEAK